MAEGPPSGAPKSRHDPGKATDALVLPGGTLRRCRNGARCPWMALRRCLWYHMAEVEETIVALVGNALFLDDKAPDTYDLVQTKLRDKLPGGKLMTSDAKPSHVVGLLVAIADSYQPRRGPTP